MAFTLLQVGTTLKLVSSAGEFTTLVLPAGITLSEALTPRFTVMNGYVVMVNSPSRPITIDGKGVVRVLTPTAPGSIPLLAGAAGGALTGTYLVRQTYRVRDDSGRIISESAYGPVSLSGTIAAQYLKASNLSISSDAVTESELYRTTTLGSVFFPWLGVSGNTQTAAQDDLSDAGLGILQGPILGAAPDLTRIITWKDRLWGVDRVAIDDIRYTEAGRMYAWGDLNSIPMPQSGTDARGIIGFAPRKDSLLIGKANVLTTITGTGNADFRNTVLSEMLGIESQESVIVYRDTVYFLWKDGVYQWNSGGITCISDGVNGKGNVRSWFTTNSYFNRRQFSVAFAAIDPIENKYRLYLCSAASDVVDRWVEFDLDARTWWGPHSTGAFTPQCALLRYTNNALMLPVVGDTSGFVWQKQDLRTDNTATAIDFSVDSKRHDMADPTSFKYWGSLLVTQVPQAAGTLVVTPAIGDIGQAPTAPLTATLTDASQGLPRLGIGRTAQLNFRENTAGRDVELLGYEVDDVHVLGTRL